MTSEQLVIGGALDGEYEDVGEEVLDGTELLIDPLLLDELADEVLAGMDSDELDPALADALAEALPEVINPEAEPLIEEDALLEELALADVEFWDPEPPTKPGHAVGIGSWKPVIQPNAASSSL